MDSKKAVWYLGCFIVVMLLTVLQDSRSITAACQHYMCAGIEVAGMTQPLVFTTNLDAAFTTQQAIAKSILYGDRGPTRAKKPTETNS